MTQLYKLTDRLKRDIKRLQNIMLEKSQSEEWKELYRREQLKNINILQEAIFVIEKY